jgi:hypothetical protein
VKLNDYKLVFFSIALIGFLLIASPAIGAVLRFPSGEKFSELYLLDFGHLAEDYPYNVNVGQNYTVYLGVGNHLGSSAYYSIYVKFQNQTDLLPNVTNGTPSPSQSLIEYRFAVRDGEYRDSPFTFAITEARIVGSHSFVNQLIINNVGFDIETSAVWESNRNAFHYQLVFELWLYDVSSDSLQFNNRYISLQLNLTKTT